MLDIAKVPYQSKVDANFFRSANLLRRAVENFETWSEVWQHSTLYYQAVYHQLRLCAPGLIQ